MSHTRGGSVGQGQNVTRKSNKRSRIILGAAVASALAGMTASSVRAVDYSWTGTAGGPSFWDVGTNWNPAGVPGLADNAAFAAGAVDTSVDLHADVTVFGSGQQSINNIVFSSTGYNILNGSLSVGGTVTQTGTGTNRISAQVTANNDWSVSGGTLILGNTSTSNANNFQSRIINVGGGATLSVVGGSPVSPGGVNIHNLSNPTANANVALGDGATFRANGIFSGENSLKVSYFDAGIDQLDPNNANNNYAAAKFIRLGPSAQQGNGTIDSGRGLLTLTPNKQGGWARPLSMGDQNQGGPLGVAISAPIASEGAITHHEDFAVAWTGNLHVAAGNAGIWNFGTISDDGTTLWLDLNHNGVFELTTDPTTTELIVNNNFDQGPTFNNNNGTGNRPASHPDLNLAEGDYNFALGWFEGRVTGEATAGFISPTMRATAGGTLDPAVAANYQVINPGKAGSATVAATAGDPQSVGQGGLWSWNNSGNLMYNADYTTTSIAVAAAASSTVQVDALSAKFGPLTLGAGSTLNVTGSGPALFANTTAQGTVTINAGQDVSTGVIGNGGGSITRINKSGAGTLIMDDLSGTSGLTNASTVSVQGGRLRIRSDGTNTPLGGAAVSLDGGSMTVVGPTGVNGFQGRWYNYTGNPPESNIDPIENQLSQTPTFVRGHTGPLGFSDGASIGEVVTSVTNNAVDLDTFAAAFVSRLHISAANAGVYQFSTISDDGTTIWIDLNHNGKFEYNSDPNLNELIVNNNVYQGPTRRTNNSPAIIRGHSGHPNLNLAAGDYDVAIGWYEGGGGAEMQAFWQGPATNGGEEEITGGLHPGVWKSLDGSATDANFAGSNVTVTQDSSIEVFNSSASFGTLTVAAGKSLTFNGLGMASFTSTSGAGGNLLIRTDDDFVHADGLIASMSAGNIIDGGGLTGIVKQGVGTLILDGTSAPSGLGAGSNVSIPKGALIAATDGINNPLGAASVTLGDGTSLSLGTKAAGAVSFNNIASTTGTVRVSAGKFGSGAIDGGDLTLGGLTVAPNGIVNLSANNGYFFTIAQNNLQGNATYNNSSSDQITLGNVTGVASSVLTLNGANRMRITGNVTGNNVVINVPGVNFDPGVATTKTVNANTTVNTQMRIATGVIDYGQNVITGAPAHFVAGLRETRIDNNAFATGAITAADLFVLDLRRANMPSINTDGGPDPVTGWRNNSTYAYQGQFLVPDNDVAGDGLGKISWAEQFDDNVLIRVDGVERIRDTSWNTATTTGTLVLSAGWHDIDIRVGQGGGGVGAAGQQGWPNDFGVVFDSQGRGSLVPTDYAKPVDNGSQNMFRSLIPTAGTIDIESGTELKAGGLTAIANVNLNGNSGLSKLTLNNHTTASNSDVVNLNLLGGNSLGEVSVGTNTTLTASRLFIEDLGSTLTKSGAGVLRVSGPSAVSGATSIVGGKLQWNGVGTGPGGVTVESGGTLGGTGTFNGAINVNTGGSISPHDGTGVATLTINDSVNMNPAARLDYNFGNTGDSLTVLNNFTLSGNSTLNVNAIVGFSTGTYRLVTMTNFTDTGDIVLGTNNGPAAFNYSIVETAPNGGNLGHIDLVVTAQVLKWTGAFTSVWDINGTANWQNQVPAAAKYIDLTSVEFNNSYTDGTGVHSITNRNVNITAASVAPASVTVNNDAAHPYTIGGNPIAGPTGITKRGVGTLSLTGGNTYIGNVIVEEGTLDVNSLANANSPSPLGGGTLPVTLGGASTAGTLRYSGGAAGSTDRGLLLAAGGGIVDNTQNATFGGIVSGAGNLTKTGTGTLTLSGAANTMTGSLTVNGGTLSVASMGIGASPAVVSIGAGRTFEYTGPTQTGGRGITTTDAASTFSVTNAATNLTLNGNVNGPTINKGGAGTLTLGGLVNYTGTSHTVAANSGTLAYTGTGNAINGTYTVESGSTLRSVPGGISNVAVTLNGGTLSLAGPTPKAGIVGEFYQFGPSQAILNTIQDFDNVLAANTKYATSNTSSADLFVNVDNHGAINNNAGNGNPFSQYLDDTTLTQVAAPGGNDNLVTRWTGTINISSSKAGLTTFFTASDDGSVLWVDGVKVVDNNFFQGVTERSGQINLAEGAHSVVIGFYEGGGGAGMIWRWTPNGGGKEVVPNNVLSSGSADWNNNVSVNPGTTSGIDVGSVATGNLGALNLGGGSTLKVTSGGVHFSGTTLAAAGGTYNFNGGWDINLNQVSSSGAVTLNHSGIGKLILETNNLAGPAAGSVINMTGGDLGAVGDAGLTNPLGSASVTLGTGSGILLGARSGDASFDNLVSGSGTVRVTGGIPGSATAGPHVLTLGSATNPFTLADGATVNLQANYGTSLSLPAVQLAGSATLNHSSTNVGASNNVRFGNINMAGGTATFTGARQMTLTGNVTGTANVVVNNNALNVDPGASNTSNINGPVKVVTTLNVTTGTTNLGSNIISGQTATVSSAGLNEYFADGAFYEGAIAGRPNSFNVPDTVQLSPRYANQAPGNTNGNPPGQGGNPPGWRDNATNIYIGQILVPDNDIPFDGIGSVAFYMRFDDSVLLKIDGTQRMRDTTWSNATSSGRLDLKAGWHDIEMRFGEGGGGVGPNTGWANPPANQFANGDFAAMGYQTDPTLGFDGNSGTNGAGDFNGTGNVNRYFAPKDNGTMNMFRVAAGTESGEVNVASGATLSAGGVDKLLTLNLNGDTAPASVNLTANFTGSVYALRAKGNPGASNVVNLSGGNTLVANQLVVSDGTLFNKDGAGTLRVEAIAGAPLSSTHQFGNDSEVHVNAGKLILNTTSFGGTGSVFVHSGGTLGGNGTITGAVGVDAGGRVAPGSSIGLLTVGALSLDSSFLDIEGGASGIDSIKVASDGTADVFTLSGNSVITLADLGGILDGQYVLIDYNNTAPITDALTHLSIGNPSGFVGHSVSLLSDEANQNIVLVVGPGNPILQWNVDNDGSWGNAANWSPPGVPDAANAVAGFLGKITAPRTVTLDGNRTVDQLNFDNANAYTIASGTGGTLTVMSQINLTSGSHAMTAPLAIGGNTTVGGAGALNASGGVSIAAGNTLTKSGTGTLSIGGAQSHGAGSALVVNRGVVNLNSNAGTAGSAAGSNLALSIVGGGGSARVNLGSNQDVASLNIAFADASTQTLDLASPAGAGQFHSISVYAANLESAKATLYNALVNANKDGAIDPLDGITDSSLHNGAKVGLASLGDHILIRSTRIGDLNLDGQVTISDFIDLASNFNTIGTATWQEGDLNYDRNVTISDFIDLASNFNGNYSGSVGAVSDSDMQTLASFASSLGVDPSVIGTAVPEPGTMSLLAIGAMGLMNRRRRSRKA